MCNQKLINYTGPKKQTIHGWKVFYKNREGKLSSMDRGNRKELPKQEWLNEKNYRSHQCQGLEYIEIRSGEKYKLGFHIFLNKENAQEWADITGDKITPVLATNITSAGLYKERESESYVIVADNIYIL